MNASARLPQSPTTPSSINTLPTLAVLMHAILAYHPTTDGTMCVPTIKTDRGERFLVHETTVMCVTCRTEWSFAHLPELTEQS